jgi:ribosomal protein S14
MTFETKRCDRCGVEQSIRRTADNPQGLNLLAIGAHDCGPMDYYGNHRKVDLCRDCANELGRIIQSYLRKEAA